MIYLGLLIRPRKMGDPSYNNFSGESGSSDRAPLCNCGVPSVMRFSFTKNYFGKRFYDCVNYNGSNL
jgi:hypothetical protein